MSILRALVILMTLMAASVVLSQLPLGKSASMMSVDEAIEAARAADTGTAALQFFEDAMKSGRIEIIETCWRGIYTHELLSKAVTERPDSSLKDQLISRFLRNPGIWWPDGSPMALNMGMAVRGKVEFIIPLVRRYLPDTPMDYSMLSTREKRLKLADQFDKAAGIPIEEVDDAKRVWPPKPGTGQGVPQDGGDATKPGLPGAAAAAAKPAETASLLSGWALWAGIAAAVAAAAGWLLLRRKDGGGKG